MDELKLTADSVGQIAEAIQVPVERWPGNCHTIACAMVSALKIPRARAVYGHYRGTIAEGSMFKQREGTIVRHGWVVLEGRVVLDPTRWAFECREPYLYIGPVSEEYDEGGDRWRQEWNDERSAPAFDPDAHRPDGSPALEDLYLVDEALVFVTGLLPDCPVRAIQKGTQVGATVTLSVGQLFWLANLSRAKLGKHAVEVYHAIIGVGQEATIPLDNQQAVLGQ